MKYIIDKTEQYTLIELQDEKLDATKSPKLKSEFVTINAEGCKNIIVDMSKATYVDSTGLSALLTGKRICENSGGIFVLVGVSDHAKKLMQITQLDKVLLMLPTVQEGIDAVFLHEIESDLGKEENN